MVRVTLMRMRIGIVGLCSLDFEDPVSRLEAWETIRNCKLELFRCKQYFSNEKAL